MLSLSKHHGSRNELLSHVNVIFHQFQDLLRVVAEFLAEVGIVEVGEVFDHVIDDAVGEHALGGVDFAVLSQFLGGSHAAVGQLLEALLQLLVLFVVDVDAEADVGLSSPKWCGRCSWSL